MKKLSIKQEWWRQRYIVEGQLIGTYNNLVRMLNLNSLTDKEKRQLSLIAPLLYAVSAHLKEERAESFSLFKEKSFITAVAEKKRDVGAK